MLVSHFMITYSFVFGKLKGSSTLLRVHWNGGGASEQQNNPDFEKSLTWSGCRELNPVYMHPMHAYCRYTTARYRKF